MLKGEITSRRNKARRRDGSYDDYPSITYSLSGYPDCSGLSREEKIQVRLSCCKEFLEYAEKITYLYEKKSEYKKELERIENSFFPSIFTQSKKEKLRKEIAEIEAMLPQEYTEYEFRETVGIVQVEIEELRKGRRV